VVEEMGGAWGRMKSVGILPVRRKSEAGGAWGRMKGAGGQHWAEGRNVPFYSGSQIRLCLVGCSALVGCFLFS
jgi:hypothetical protein